MIVINWDILKKEVRSILILKNILENQLKEEVCVLDCIDDPCLMDDACPSDATCSFHCYHHECACDEGFVPTVRLYFYLI